MSNLQVPDPGLLCKIDHLVAREGSVSESLYFDVKIICKNGHSFTWSKLLLSGVSEMMRNVFYSVDEEQQVLILPDVDKDSMEKILSSLISPLPFSSEMDREDFQVLKLLNIKAEYFEQKMVTNNIRITSVPFVSSSISKVASSSHDTDDVDILFYAEEEESKQKVVRKMFCKYCNMSFKSQQFSKYQDHINSHKNIDGMFWCNKENCGKLFKTWSHLSDHFYSHDKSPKPHLCSYCNYTSITRANVRKHELAVHEDPERRDYQCDKCDKKFKTSSNLVEHQKTHGNEKYTCQFCAKTFKTLIGFNQHQRAHTGELFPCHSCGEKFQSKNSVNRHLKDVHGIFDNNSGYGSKVNKCPKKGCSAEFSSEEDYRLHLRSAHQDNGAVLICHLCRKMFPTKQALKQHFKKLHRESGETVLKTKGKSILSSRQASSSGGVSVLKQGKNENREAVHASAGTKDLVVGNSLNMYYASKPDKEIVIYVKNDEKI